MKCSCRLGLSVIAICLVTAYQHGYQGGALNLCSLIFELFVEFEDEFEEPYFASLYDVRIAKARLSDYSGKGFLDLQRFVYKEKQESILFPVTVAMFPLGAILGSAMPVLWLHVCDCGHLYVMHYSFLIILIGIISETLCRFAKKKAMLIVGRLLIGIGVGLCDGVAPLYLAEIAPPKTRATVLTSYQFFVTLGMLSTQIGGVLVMDQYRVPTSGFLNNCWPIWILSVSGYFILILCITLPFCEESPRYFLMNKKDKIRAKSALIWLRNTDDIEDEVEEMEEEYRSIQQSNVALRDLVQDPSFRCCLIIVMIEQLCGVNVLIYYSIEILIFMGFEHIADVCALAITFCMFTGTIVSLILVSREVNRKLLLLVSLGGMFVSTIIMFLDFLFKQFLDTDSYCCISMFLFALFYGIGVGPARWLIITEMFDYSARPLVVSLIQPLNFFLDFLIAIIFGLLKSNDGCGVFILFAFFHAGAFWYVIMRMPKTK